MVRCRKLEHSLHTSDLTGMANFTLRTPNLHFAYACMHADAMASSAMQYKARASYSMLLSVIDHG